MGITGLLPFLKSIQHPTHVSEFRGQTVVVDAYCWLHKGCYSCSLELIEGRDTEMRYVNYCMRKINILLKYNVNPVLVFDGANLPSKRTTEEKRKQYREMFRDRGVKYLREGKRKEAYDNFKHCIDVKPEYALNLIKACRESGIQCIVSPYEADAQLAYMVHSGLAYAVVSEDSDLLVFGCERVLFKMDDVGSGLLINLSEVGNIKKPNMLGFGRDSFRHMCILSGCDYLKSIPGVGLITAHKLMRKYLFDPYRVIESLRIQHSKCVPVGYEEMFKQADMTFLFQIVFDPRSKVQVHLNPLPQDIKSSELTYVGILATPHKAKELSRGNINPITNAVMGNYTPTHDKNIQHGFKNDPDKQQQKIIPNFFKNCYNVRYKKDKTHNVIQNNSLSGQSMKVSRDDKYNALKRNIFSMSSDLKDVVYVYSRFFSKPNKKCTTIKDQSRYTFVKEMLPPDIFKLRNLCYKIGNQVKIDTEAIIYNQIKTELVNKKKVKEIEKEKVETFSHQIEKIKTNILFDRLSPKVHCSHSTQSVISYESLPKNNEINVSLTLQQGNKNDAFWNSSHERNIERNRHSEVTTKGKLVTSKDMQDTKPSKNITILSITPETHREVVISESQSDDSDVEFSNLTPSTTQSSCNQYFCKPLVRKYRRPLNIYSWTKRRPLIGSSRQLTLKVHPTKGKN